MTPWCFFDFRKMAFEVLRGDLAKRLLGVGVIWPKDSLVLIQPWHQGVFCPDHPNTKESFVQTTPLKENTFKNTLKANLTLSLASEVLKWPLKCV